jgi:hypothetical protein
MKKIFIKKIIPISVITLFFAQALYITFIEPTILTAATDSDAVVVTLNVDAGISITDGAAATMSPNIGVTQNKSVGSSSWNVKTNNAAGYTLTVKADAAPALVKVAPNPDSFADYTPAVGGTPDTWGGVGSSTKEFGFSARGTDVLASYGPGASDCGSTVTGIPNATSKFLGFNNTTPIQIATRSTVTTPSGVDTNICFAAEQGSGVYAASGTYTTTVTATASTL